MTTIMAQCVFCKRLKTKRGPGGEWMCESFGPDPIPEEIKLNQFDHRFKHPNDAGLLYDPKPGAPPHPMGVRFK